MTESLSADLCARYERVIAVLDVVESVRLMEENEAAFIEHWHRFTQHVLREVLPGWAGRLHKSLGDGLMIEFPDARSAAGAALAIQRHSRELRTAQPSAAPMHIRIGLHRATYVRDEHDIYGVGVNLASRVAGQAGPDEIVASAAVRDELAETVDADVEDLGECFLKHVAEPVRLYRIEEPRATRPAVETSTGAHQTKPTIAVIPFKARSSGEHHLAIGELIAESVIGQLSRTPDIRVISRLSATVFRGHDAPTEAAKKHLKANYVLVGSYVADGDRLLMTAELANEDGEVVWSKRLGSTVGDLLQPECELSHQIAAAAHEALLAREVQRSVTQRLPTLQSHSLMLGAITLMHRTTASDFARAEEMLDLLLERHQRHAELLAWKAKWHVLQVEQGWAPDAQRSARVALSRTARALDIEPQSSLALTIDGFVRCNLLEDFDAAKARYEAAIEANPSESLAWLLKGMMHGFKGEVQSALIGVDTALALSPLDPARYFFLSLAASVHLSAGEYDRAVQFARDSLKSNRTHLSTYRALVIALTLRGQIDEARQEAARLLRLDPGFTVSRFLTRRRGAKYATAYADALLAAGVPRN